MRSAMCRQLVSRLVLVAIVTTFAAKAHAQVGSGTLYTLEFLNGRIAVYVLDPATGGATLLVETDATSITGPVSALDVATGRLFFVSGGELYTVNLHHRTFSHTPAIGSELQFDSTSRQLYTLGFSNGHVALYALNPATGGATLVVETDAVGITGPVSALDEASGRFFFRSSGELYTIDIRQRTFSHVPAGGSELQFDSVRRQLYTLDFSNGHVALYTLDPVTGSMTLIVETNATGITGPFSALDEASGRLFFRSAGELYTIDIQRQSFSHVAAIGSELQFAEAAAPVPSLSAAMVLVLSCVLAGLALLRLSA